jgi:hypothetical protein
VRERLSGRREIALAALGLGLLALAVYGGHVTSGGFALDDWTIADALRRFPGASGLHAVITIRPLLQYYLYVVGHVLGVNHAAWLLWAVMLAVATSAALFALLRRAGFGVQVAAAAAALLLVFPWADSLKLWAATSASNAAITVALCGALLTLRSTRETGRRAALLAASGTLLYGAAILIYEHALAIVVLGSALLFVRTTWRRALALTSVAAVVSGACAYWIATTTKAASQPDLASTVGHYGRMLRQSWELLGRAATPIDTLWPVASVLVLAVLAVGAALARRAAPAVRTHVILAGLGIGVILAAYAIIAPGLDWYVPLQPGQGTRTNSAAAVGWAMLFAGVIGIIGTLTRRAVVAGVVLVLVIVTWSAHSAADGRDWAAASAIGESVIAVAKASPELRSAPAGSRVYAFGVPRTTSLEVPVFNERRDFGAALRLSLSLPLTGAMVFTNSVMRCGEAGPVASGGFQKVMRSDYGRSFFLDYTGNRVVAVPDRATCEALLASGTLRGGPTVTYG